MKLSQIDNPEFKAAIEKLMQSSLPVKTTFSLKKYILALESEMKSYAETKDKLLKEYCLKEEDGSPKTQENGSVLMDMSKAEEWQLKFTELFSLDSQVEAPVVKLDSLPEDCKLSVSELMLLDEIIKE